METGLSGLKGVTSMTKTLVRAGLALSIAVTASSGWATTKRHTAKIHQSITTAGEPGQRKDVDEVSRPSPPTGPSSEVIVCNPSAVDCP
jgi:hypothetical protein